MEGDKKMIGSIVRKTWGEVTNFEKLVLIVMGLILLLNKLVLSNWDYMTLTAGAEIALAALFAYSLIGGQRWRASILYLILAVLLFIAAFVSVMIGTPTYGWYL